MITKASNVRIDNTGKATCLATNARVAGSFRTRLVGLLSRKRLQPGEGMVLSPGSCIHTFFMRMPIDVVFTDKQGKVVKTAFNVKPWRMVMAPLSTRYTIELPIGVIDESNTAKGDDLTFTAV